MKEIQPAVSAELYYDRIDALKRNLSSVILGKSESVNVLITALLAGGSVLIEDVPGVGKTTLAKALAKSVNAQFNRIQFTPDLLPADILGSSVYNPATGSFSFRKGPVFCNILLADEINRASPRTQSALLEAMNEAQVTIEGVRYPLPSPFFVLATENPVEFHGTYPLPEAQLDRFLVQINIGYPDYATEMEIIQIHLEKSPLESLQPVISPEDIVTMQKQVCLIHVDECLRSYIVDIISRTRNDPRLKLGVSPRGTLMLFRAAQAAAFSERRGFVLPDDVQKYAPFVLSHRIVLTSRAKYGGIEKRRVIEDIVSSVKVPL